MQTAAGNDDPAKASSFRSMNRSMRPAARLRILHIAESYPPDYGGGAGIYIQDVCRALAGRGHEVRVLCVENVDGEPYRRRTDVDGRIRVERINLPYFKAQDPDGWRLGMSKWRKHERRVADIMRQFLSEWTPDIAHYSTTRPLGEECLLAVHRAGVPLVGFLHEAWLICPRIMLLRSPASEACSGPGPVRCLNCLYSHYDKTNLRAAAKLPWRLFKLGPFPAYRLWRRAIARRRLRGAMAYSQFMRRVHQAHIPEQVRYVQLGINLAGAPSQSPRRPRTPLRFGFVAGFQPHKGVLDVLDAAATLKREGRSFELHIWGPNQEMGPAEIAARDLQDRAFLRGAYQPEELWDAYSEIDVALMATTVCEPFGRVPLEAAVAGAPTIAPAIGGISESIRHDFDGLLYRFRDREDLTRQMRRILAEPGILDRLIQNLKMAVDTADAGAEIEQFYFDVLGSAGSEVELALAG